MTKTCGTFYSRKIYFSVLSDGQTIDGSNVSNSVAATEAA